MTFQCLIAYGMAAGYGCRCMAWRSLAGLLALAWIEDTEDTLYD